MIDPGAILLNISAVTNRGAGRPGTAAVVISTLDFVINGVKSSRCLAARSSVISRAYPPAPSIASSPKSIKVAPIERTSSAEDARTS
ncbi:unannotated protein [freshwater metagenome]|uniref:Unannotated protein n=1 Tax=freshwater metagenome TaxID=449393 RepID=A0A6J6MN26_9ZZZZ